MKHLRRTIYGETWSLRQLWIYVVQLRDIVILWPSQRFILILSRRPIIVVAHHEPILQGRHLYHQQRRSKLKVCFRGLILLRVSRNIFLVEELWFLVV